MEILCPFLAKIQNFFVVLQSLPTRGAWIEITMEQTTPTIPTVAPHTGSVD